MICMIDMTFLSKTINFDIKVYINIEHDYLEHCNIDQSNFHDSSNWNIELGTCLIVFLYVHVHTWTYKKHCAQSLSNSPEHSLRQNFIISSRLIRRWSSIHKSRERESRLKRLNAMLKNYSRTKLVELVMGARVTTIIIKFHYDQEVLQFHDTLHFTLVIQFLLPVPTTNS